MTSFIVSTIAYLIALWLASYWLVKNDIELPTFSRWIIVNSFAFLVSYLMSLPF